MDRQKLEEVLEKRVEPVIDVLMKKFLGVRISEIKSDISDQILKSPLLGLPIEYSLPFKKAKAEFKQAFLQRMLQIHYGNISEVARITGVDRRSIHRIVKKTLSRKIRKELIRPYYLKQKEVESIIENVLDKYKGVVNNERMEKLYSSSQELSRDIVDILPDEDITLKEAEEEFERRYLARKLEENDFNISKTARNVKLRYETLLRKMKALGIKV